MDPKVKIIVCSDTVVVEDSVLKFTVHNSSNIKYYTKKYIISIYMANYCFFSSRDIHFMFRFLKSSSDRLSRH